MPRPLRIIHTEASLGWGGQEIRVFGEMQAMRARGHHLALAAQPAARITAHAAAAGFEVFPLSEAGWRYPATITALARWFRRWRPDVVNTHSSRDGWQAGIAARLARVPLILRSRHIEVDYPSRRMSRIAFGTLPHAVLTTSRRISTRLVAELGLDPARVHDVPTGIDPALFHPGIPPADLRGPLGLPASARFIGMVSVIRSWKGHAHFLDAAARLAPVHPELHFAIAGDGPGRDKLPAKIEAAGLTGRAHALGHRADVAAVLRALDILVLPSTAHEGVPQIILQAQACGVPVVATRVGGIPEVVEDGVTGVLVPPADGAALAAALQPLLEDPARRARLAAAARGRFLENHTLDRMCERVETLCTGFLGTR